MKRQNPQSKSKRYARSLRAWIFLSGLVALIEIDVAAVTSEAFRQHLRDSAFFIVYRNLLGLVLVYVLVGGLGWTFGWILSLTERKKGEAFFVRNPLAIFGTLSITVYGFWALRKFLYLEGLLNLLGLALGTVGIALAAGALSWGFQRFLSKRIRQDCAIVLALVTILVPIFLRFPFPHSPLVSDLPNVVLLSVDTLHPDHLGCYGYEKAHTPNIDRLASHGLLFRQAYAQIPLTGPSFSSIATGLYPRTHGARQNLTFMTPSVATLAEVLREEGYRTAAFVSGYPLKREFCSLSKGFDLYQDRFSFFDGFKLLRFLERFGVVELQLERRAEAVSRLSIPWFRRQRQNPFFVWIHYYDPHIPYRPPLPPSVKDPARHHLRRHQRHLWGKGGDALSPEIVDEMTALYDGEIAYVDQDIGRILSFLDREGLREKTLIVFVSDHGESFDHNYYFDHGDRLYESTIRIPVIFSYPGRVPEGASTDQVIQSVDLFPTILYLLNLPERASEGTNLFVKKGKSKPLVYAELSRRPGHPTFGDLWALRDGSWKLIYSPEGRSPELYNLTEDPYETVNLASKEPGRLGQMTEHLVQWMGEEKKGPVRMPKETLTREKLKSLGYLQ